MNSVSNLLKCNFPGLSLEDKIKIKELCRTLPDLKLTRVFTLYGLTSWGQHCGYANKPGVYVKVGYYREWIDDIITKHS
ncbi:hypothetical protein NQ317_013520 [Molorchus minor]|uniref:Peptidase S1 domain-containing protein n=1 Tax=Molorchus minor TaxID=1323400 RepID=A0ABQ9JV55_9CUCU|nr:hypothetical protein NQ317_013520 [Molorchus minor]